MAALVTCPTCGQAGDAKCMKRACFRARIADMDPIPRKARVTVLIYPIERGPRGGRYAPRWVQEIASWYLSVAQKKKLVDEIERAGAGAQVDSILRLGGWQEFHDFVIQGRDFIKPRREARIAEEERLLTEGGFHDLRSHAEPEPVCVPGDEGGEP